MTHLNRLVSILYLLKLQVDSNGNADSTNNESMKNDSMKNDSVMVDNSPHDSISNQESILQKISISGTHARARAC